MAAFAVTGGCGFLGTHLTRALLTAAHEVRVIDDLSTGEAANLPLGAELVVGDLRDPRLLRRTLDGVAGCFHLAAVASVRRCQDAWWESHQVNLGATIALFEQARRQKLPVVYASSAAVYGTGYAFPLREDSGCRPLSPYGVDKLACELHATVAAELFGLRTLGLRFFNLFGPGQRADDAYAGVISVFASCLEQGRAMTIYGDGLQTRDFVFVADAARAAVAAMDALRAERPPTMRVVNVCTGRGTSIRELAQLMSTLAGCHVGIQHAPAQPGDICCSLGSPDGAERVLAFRASTPLEEGLRLTLEALRSAKR